MVTVAAPAVADPSGWMESAPRAQNQRRASRGEHPSTTFPTMFKTITAAALLFAPIALGIAGITGLAIDRKSTRLNSSHRT